MLNVTEKRRGEQPDSHSRQFVSPSPEALSEIQSLYDAGLCLQAYQAAQKFGPIKMWQGVRPRILAGRLAVNVGGNQLSRALHWLAWRTNKSDPDVTAYHGQTILQSRGPLAALEFLERPGNQPSGPDTDGLMHYFTLRAMVSAHLRDFAGSDEYLERAAACAGEHPWLETTRAHVYELQDRYADALNAAERSLKLRPWYRPGIQAVAHALQLLDRDDDALALLTRAAAQIENMHVVRQLAALQREHGLYADADSSLVRFEELAPLMEEDDRLWLLRERVTLGCLRDDPAAALAAAKQVDEPYYRGLAERLERGIPGRRVRLDVPFVRQHHMTCAPATLAAISRHWKKPAGQLEIAEAICYDGTPAHSERTWAETGGWVAREFTVTWDAAVALLDRGIPFTLTTSEATSAHLQAVVGYDELRQTLWIRDPFIYYAAEAGADSLLKRYRATGPRGMALVPADRSELFDGLALPDAGLYDQTHKLQRALANHRRADAVEVCQQMEADAPDHRLTLTARRAIATYDGNTPALLEALELLLKQFPADGNLNLCKLSCLHELARRDERLRLLEELCRKPATDPIFWQQYAQELRMDARQRPTAATWIRWALRYRPTDPSLIGAWADALWDERDFVKAKKYYRLAACLGDKREQFSQSFFIASRHLRETEAALEFLQKRNARLAAKSSAPTITLIDSLRTLGRTHEAGQCLETALAARPADGELRLFAADFYGRFSRFEPAEESLRKASDCCRSVAWHRAAASLADYRNDKPAALSHWHEVLKTEPLAHDAIRSVTTLVAETESREAAFRFLGELCERFPFSCPLLALRIQWTREDGAEAVIPHIRRLIEVNPADAWAWRELALQAAAARNSIEALDAAQEAIRLEPNHSAGYSVRADVLSHHGRIREARADWRQALRLEVDNEHAMSRFVETGATLAERKEALVIVAEEMRRQVIFREALLAYQQAARGLLPPQEVLELLREAHLARPDLWQSWSVYINQMVDVGSQEDALKIAGIATQRFPLLPRLWVDLARVEQARLNADGEIAALEKALELSAGYSFASRQLAGAHERRNELPKARAVIEQAVATNPLDPENQGYLAHLMWKQNERDAALGQIKKTLQLQPGFSWAWSVLKDWGAKAGSPNLATQTARELTRVRAGEARSWLMLAQSLPVPESADEIFAALDRAVALNPVSQDAYDCRARTLAQLNRFDDALAVCGSWPRGGVPARLKFRAVWIEMQRGNVPRAITLAKQALEEHPDDYWGWQLLSDCHLNNNQPNEAVQAAEKMAALAPLEAVPLGYLGDLKLRLGDKAGAGIAFQRAFTLDPDYQYAGFQLFHFHLGGDRLKEAQSTLKILQRRGETHETLSCLVKLESALGQPREALESFKRLCSFAEVHTRSITHAANALEQRGQGKSMNQWVNEQIKGGTCTPALAEFWVNRQVAQDRWGLHPQLNTLKSKGESGRRAILRYLDHLGAGFDRMRQKHDVTGPLLLRYCLWQLLRKHRHWLKTDTEGWGKVGYVLTGIGRPGAVVSWLSDWKNRPQAESWMLYNLVIMLQRKKRYAESREIIRHAVTLRHQEKLYEIFRLWAAFEEALAGNFPAAAGHLAVLTPENIQPQSQPLKTMTELLIDLHRQPADGRKPFARTIQSRIRQAFEKYHPCNAGKYVRDGYRRFVSAAAPEAGGFGFKLWGWWYYRGTIWLLVPGFILLVVMLVLGGLNVAQAPLLSFGLAAIVINLFRRRK